MTSSWSESFAAPFPPKTPRTRHFSLSALDLSRTACITPSSLNPVLRSRCTPSIPILARACYEEYARVIGLRSVEDLAHRLEDVLELAQMDASLSELGVVREMIPTLAQDAAKQWTATFNPRPIEAVDFERLYEETYE